MLVAYGASLLTFLILDAIWLGWVAKKKYERTLAPLLREHYRMWPWVVFYLLYNGAVVHLAVAPHLDSAAWLPVAISAAVLGLAAYGAYNLTNVAIVKDWPVAISLTDWAWGTFITIAAGMAGWAAAGMVG